MKKLLSLITSFALLFLISCQPDELEELKPQPDGKLKATNQDLAQFSHFSEYAWDAKDVSIGADGTVYKLGVAAVPGGYQIFKWNGSSWTLVPGGAVRVAVSPQGVPWIVSSIGEIFRLNNGVWQKMPGAAKEIAIGANGTVYVLGTATVSGGYQIFKWNGSSWTLLPGGAVRVAVNPKGVPWIVSSVGEVFLLSNNVWQRIPEVQAKDISIGAEGTVYVLGTVAGSGGYQIFRWYGFGWGPVSGSSGAIRIAVSPQGEPWFIDGFYRSIFRLTNSVWQKMPEGHAKDVAVGADGTTYVLVTAAVTGGYQILRRNSSSWTLVPGGAVRVAVNPQGVPWIVSSVGEIFRLSNGVWQRMPGAAKDIGIGADGTVYVLGTAAVTGGYQIFKWNGSNWTPLPGGAVRVAVSPQGVSWIVSSVGEIFRLSNGVWQRMPGAAKDIGIGADGTVYVLGTAAVTGGYQIFRWNGSSWTLLPGGAVRVAVNPRGMPLVVTSQGDLLEGVEQIR